VCLIEFERKLVDTDGFLKESYFISVFKDLDF